jgi:hypothetical protein
MTREQIEEETYKKSLKWLEAGVGTLGRLYVEVLGCDGLPNKDTYAGVEVFGNRTDAFSVLVYQGENKLPFSFVLGHAVANHF